MLDKPFAVIVGVATFLFVGSIFMESTPQARLAQSCSPVRWTGNIMGSIAALTDSEKLTEKISAGTDDFDYGCQFTLWRLMYGKEYSTAMQNGGAVRSQNIPMQPQQDAVLPPGGIPLTEMPPPGRDPNSQHGERVMLIEKSNR